MCSACHAPKERSENLFGGTVWHLEGQVHSRTKSRINLLKFEHKYLRPLGEEKAPNSCRRPSCRDAACGS